MCSAHRMVGTAGVAPPPTNPYYYSESASGPRSISHSHPPDSALAHTRTHCTSGVSFLPLLTDSSLRSRGGSPPTRPDGRSYSAKRATPKSVVSDRADMYLYTYALVPASCEQGKTGDPSALWALSPAAEDACLGCSRLYLQIGPVVVGLLGKSVMRFEASC